MTDDRTIYTITDEHGERSTITLDKIVADILQECVPDVHVWVQSTYDKIVEKKPHLGRREQGDVVRGLSWREVMNSPRGKNLLNDF